MDTYDIAIIGAGWAGISAALEAGRQNLKACLIEKAELGGVCLNRGCIPTKTLIQSAKVLSTVGKAMTFGIEVSSVKADFSRIFKRKDEVVKRLAAGIEFLLKDVEIIRAEASFTDEHTLLVQGRKIEARHIIIASGSRPVELPQLTFDGEKVFSSDRLLNYDKPIASLLVVGGGYIGCEFAGLYRAFGSKVTIAEKEPRILPGEDEEIARKLASLYQKKGISIHTSSDASKFDLAEFDKVLLAVGRRPVLDNLGLGKAGIQLIDGNLKLNEYLQTSITHIWAAGDCSHQIMLAHYAAFQGMMIVKNIVSPQDMRIIASHAVPACIFSNPEVAHVGLNEREAQKEHREVKVFRFDFRGSGMANIIDETEGFMKIIADKNTGELLGVSIIGPRANELIAVCAVALNNRLKIEDLRSTIFAHPTVAESIKDALLPHGKI